MRKLIILFLLLSAGYCFAQQNSGANQRVVLCSATVTGGTAAACTGFPAVTSWNQLNPADSSSVVIELRVDAANTGAITLDISSNGTRPIVKNVGGTAQPLAANDLRPGRYFAYYDGTNVVIPALGNSGGGGGATTTTEIVDFSLGSRSSTTNYPLMYVPASDGGSIGLQGTAPRQLANATLADGATLLSLSLPAFRLHTNYVSGGTLELTWNAAIASTNVVKFGVAVSCSGPGEALFNTETTPAYVNSTNAGNALINVVSFSVDMSGCAADDLVLLRILRDANHADDTLASTANITMARFKYTRNL